MRLIFRLFITFLNDGDDDDNSQEKILLNTKNKTFISIVISLKFLENNC